MTGKAKRAQQVHMLLVEVGRRKGDGLPERSTGAALVVYASGVDEAEAVRETVALLQTAEMSVLEVAGHGTLDEREAAGEVVEPEERALMQRALADNAVVVAQVTPFYD
jgi:hypothetical protein